MTKIAILNLYLRLAVQKTFRNIIWGCMIFVITSSMASVVASIFQCAPIHKAWDAAGTVPGSCINVNALFFANAGLDIFQDGVIYILPMRVLYQIQIPKRQKIALMGVFAVGGFVVITGMVRLNFLKRAQNTPDPSCKPFLSSLLDDSLSLISSQTITTAPPSGLESNATSVSSVLLCQPLKPLSTASSLL